jgi:hypothetical protein
MTARRARARPRCRRSAKIFMRWLNTLCRPGY